MIGKNRIKKNHNNFVLPSILLELDILYMDHTQIKIKKAKIPRIT